MLNEFQIASLLDYIKTNGELVSIYELQYIPGFTVELADMLKPFVITSQKNRAIDDLAEVSQSNTKGVAIVSYTTGAGKADRFEKSKRFYG